MNFKKKLQTRLYVAIICIALGVVMIVIPFLMPLPDDFLSSFGVAMVVVGLARVRNYRRITKTEEAVRKQEITETDERNLEIINRARSAAFSIYLLLLAAGVIVLSLFGLHEVSKWISFAVFLLVLIYWICYLVYRKKL